MKASEIISPRIVDATLRKIAIAEPPPNADARRQKAKDRPLSLRAGEPAGAGVTRVFDTLFQNAIERLEHAGSNREGDIHAVRTTIKRVRAILRLIEPAIANASFRKENQRLKKTARLLAPMRDVAIGLHTLRGLAGAATRQQKRHDASIVHDHFAKNVSMPDGVTQKSVMRVTVQALEAHRRRLRKLRIISADCQAMRISLEKVYHSCRRRMKRAFSEGDDDSFHRWRIRLKNLYYELQFLEPIFSRRLRSMIARLKRLESMIGDDHDIAVLKASLQKTPEQFGGGPVVKRVLRQLKERSDELRRAMRPLAETVLDEKPDRFARQIHRRMVKWQKAARPRQATERPRREAV
jgi:CHAD domain-containing protein